MATNIFLGYPPENIKQFIIEKYGKQEEPVDMTKVPLTFTAKEAGAEMSLKNKCGEAVTLETSTTGEEGSWQPYTLGKPIVLENVGDKIMFRNSSNKIQVMCNGIGKENVFDINSGKIAASGNILFLMDKTGELKSLEGYDYCYGSLFYNCKQLTQAPILPATTLEQYCYDSMFYSCTSLTQAPELPAAELVDGCYYNMFRDTGSIPEPKFKLSNISYEQIKKQLNDKYYVFGEYNQIHTIQCSDKKITATVDDNTGNWIFTEK